jgi:hypothetical protein
MTWTINTTSPRRLSGKLMAGLAISALLAVGTFAAPANAASADQQNLPNVYGGYNYAPPPAAYGSPYGYGQPYGYAQPYGSYGQPYNAPAVYGPGIR